MPRRTTPLRFLNQALCLASLACLALTLLPASALAHKVNVFAWAENGQIHVETYFSGGKPAMNSPLVITDKATGKELLTGETDEEGLFSFVPPQEALDQNMDLRILLKAGEGHQNDWVITAEEYVSTITQARSAQPAADQATPTAEPAPSEDPKAEAAPETNPGQASDANRSCQCPSSEEINSIVNTALENKLAPLRKELTMLRQRGPGMTEIVGGIGLIVGLAGMAFYFKAKSEFKKEA